MVRAKVRDRGQLTLPPEVRTALGVEEGDEIEFEITPDGVLMQGLTLVPTDQAWFWSKSWQAGERKASEDLAAGRVETFEDTDSFLKSLGG